MATEITEYAGATLRYGGIYQCPPMPAIRHTSLTVGDTLTFDAKTEQIEILPGEDVRIEITDGAGTPAPGATSQLLLADQVRRFSVPGGFKIKAVAAV